MLSLDGWSVVYKSLHDLPCLFLQSLLTPEIHSLYQNPNQLISFWFSKTDLSHLVLMLTFRLHSLSPHHPTPSPQLLGDPNCSFRPWIKLLFRATLFLVPKPSAVLHSLAIYSHGTLYYSFLYFIATCIKYTSLWNCFFTFFLRHYKNKNRDHIFPLPTFFLIQSSMSSPAGQ